MDNIEQILKYLHLSDKAIEVYLALLKAGKASAQSLAIQTNIKRASIYSILRELKEKGLLAEIPGKTKTIYRPLSPRGLFEQTRKKLGVVAKTIPEIEAQLSHPGGMKEKPQSLFFSGEKGIMTLLTYEVEELADKELREFLLTATPETLDFFHRNFPEYDKKLQKLNFTQRGISPAGKNITEYNKKYRSGKDRFNIKVVPKEIYGSPVTVEIGYSWVKIYDLENLQGMLLKSEAIAKTFGQIFELAWRGAEVIEKEWTGNNARIKN